VVEEVVGLERRIPAPPINGSVFNYRGLNSIMVGLLGRTVANLGYCLTRF
jgi:hypothetical protein